MTLLLLLGNYGIHVHLLLASAHALLLAVGLGLLLLLFALALALVLRFLLGTGALVQCRQVYVALHLQSCVGLLGGVQTEDTVLQCACNLAVGNDLRFVGGGLLNLYGFGNRFFNLLLLLHGRFCLLLGSIQVYVAYNLQCLLLCLGLFLGLCLCLFLGFRLCIGFCLGLCFGFCLFLFLAFLLLLLLLEHEVGGILQHTVRFELLQEQFVLLVRNLGVEVCLHLGASFLVEEIDGGLQAYVTLLYGFA